MQDKIISNQNRTVLITSKFERMKAMKQWSNEANTRDFSDQWVWLYGANIISLVKCRMPFSIEKMVEKLRKVHECFHQLFFRWIFVRVVLFCFLPECRLHRRGGVSSSCMPWYCRSYMEDLLNLKNLKHSPIYSDNLPPSNKYKNLYKRSCQSAPLCATTWTGSFSVRDKRLIRLLNSR